VSTVQLSGWSFGTDESALSTMRNMSRRVRSCVSDSKAVIDTANDIISNVRSRDVVAQIDAIRDWLLHRFRFVSDPVGVELLRDPAEAIARARSRGFTMGDCDEAAMLGAALGMANGIPARFRALAFERNAPYTHVIADLLGGARWYALDITKPQGFVAPDAVRTLTLMV
jgi:transglutaminase-like putative cysteine protease